jgi:hypothetical protein
MTDQLARICLFFIASMFLLHTAEGQENDPEEILSDSKITIQKLIVGQEDRSHKLKHIEISNEKWKEFNHTGETIGIAEIRKLNDKKIKIKWLEASNGAEPGAVTKYKYNIEANEILLDMYFDHKQQGYIIGFID